MTLLDVVFKYGMPPGEKEMSALNNAWEVYVGRFMNPNQDGLFLYDRSAGQA